MNNGAQHHRSHLEGCKALPGAVAKQILGTAGTVEAPTQYCGNGKQAQRQGDGHADPIAEHGRKRLHGQLCSAIHAIDDGHAAGKDHQGGHGADNDGIDEYLHDAHKPLPDGIIDTG